MKAFKESLTDELPRPSLLTMVPTVIAGTVGAGAHWVSAAGGNALALSNPAAQDPSRSTAELFAGKVQLHPDTDPNDPMYAKFGISPEKRGERVPQEHLE
jgi:Ca2+-transporting ATPase